MDFGLPTVEIAVNGIQIENLLVKIAALAALVFIAAFALFGIVSLCIAILFPYDTISGAIPIVKRSLTAFWRYMTSLRHALHRSPALRWLRHSCRRFKDRISKSR
ncbi:hypothetical protein DSLASN_30490 [Desulfoluna limicola]|uniref:Uncharacterized protein n=1 Tax=Desulfoluna limicola TaxID=2810562 RepID=A0ABN6F7S4_9BACT|nr:hypothetical protein DSLASN_30490 [Desulfoluna limicola]